MDKYLLEQLKNIVDSHLASPGIAEVEKPQGYLVAHTSHLGHIFYLESSKLVNGTRVRKRRKLGDENSKAVVSHVIKRIRYEQRVRLETNQTVLENALKKYRDFDSASVLDSLPPAYRLISGSALDYERKQWLKQSYCTNTFPLNTVHYTSDGIIVRSRGDLLIYEALKAANIPFRYECRLVLYDENGNRVVRYPDFMILLRDGSIIIWEHLGLLVKEDYQKRLGETLSLYYLNDFLPFDNLIITADNKDGSFNMSTVMHIIENEILPRI